MRNERFVHSGCCEHVQPEGTLSKGPASIYIPGLGVSSAAALELNELLCARPVDLAAVTKVVRKEPALMFYIACETCADGSAMLGDVHGLGDCIVLIGIEGLKRIVQRTSVAEGHDTQREVLNISRSTPKPWLTGKR